MSNLGSKEITYVVNPVQNHGWPGNKFVTRKNTYHSNISCNEPLTIYTSIINSPL